MREIKFRGIHIHVMPHNSHLDGEWVYGHLSAKEYISPEDGLEKLVDPNTIGQYTGLKDRNGVEIYEGDIVTDGVFLYIVQWGEEISGWSLKDLSMSIYPFYKCFEGNREVIGNIYQNPELMEVSE